MVRRLALIGLVLVPRVAAAQAPCERSERARSLFEEARQQASGRRLARARALYLESQAICPRVPTAYNLATTHMLLGEPLEAIALLEAIEEGRLGPLEGEQREVVDAILREAREDVAVLELRATGAPRVHVRVGDDEAVHLEAGEPARVRVNPGLHRVTAHADDGRVLEVGVRVAAGETREVILPLPRAEERGRIVLTSEDERAVLEIVGVATGRGRLSRLLRSGMYQVRGPTREASIDLAPGETERIDFGAAGGGDVELWIWIGVGAALVVGAAAVTAGILLSQPTYEDDPVWGRVEM